MLNHKKLSLLIAAGLAVSLSAFPVLADNAPVPPANDAPAAQPTHKHHMNMFERLEMQLKLTDDQKTTVDPILNEAQVQSDAIRKNKDLKKDDKKAQNLAIVEGLPEKLNPTLDTKQQAILAKFVERMKNPPPREERGQHKKPADGGEQPAAAPAN